MSISTIVIAALIALAVIFSVRSYMKGNGSCGDCTSSCPVKDEMHRTEALAKGLKHSHIKE